MNRHDRYRSARLALVAAAVAVVGCSGSGDGLPREAVSGSVSLDGAPLPSGTISFNPVENSSGVAGGASIKGGKFAIPRDTGLVPGSYRVSINASSGGGDQAHPKSPEGQRRAKGATKPSETIPAKYNAKTELTTEIKRGGSNDTLNFNLTSKD